MLFILYVLSVFIGTLCFFYWLSMFFLLALYVFLLALYVFFIGFLWVLVGSCCGGMFCGVGWILFNFIAAVLFSLNYRLEYRVC